jgi:hypothetical protein
MIRLPDKNTNSNDNDAIDDADISNKTLAKNEIENEAILDDNC